MFTCAVLAAAQLVALGGGQLSGRLSDDDAPARAARSAKLSDDDAPPATAAARSVPPPTPPDLPPLPSPQALATPAPKPPAPDRVRTVDGKLHVGKVVRAIDNGFEFEDERGARYPIALSTLAASEGGEGAWKVPEPAVPEIDGEAARQALTLAFDVYELERERATLTYGEKALVLGLGLVATVVGFVAVPGDTGKGIGIAGIVGAAGGGIALGVNGLRSWQLSRRADEARAQLQAMGAQRPVAQARSMALPALAVRF